ncbi:hypothetical protein [Streptomyces clavifer]|uniref:hypothetical protein n=1 Tax=Streptomyces clavifer TaxID=68188 RepID=UPI00341AE71B
MFNAKIVKNFPPKGGLQLCRLDSATSFLCSRCHERKVAKLVATNVEDRGLILCNGCYGQLVSGAFSSGESSAPHGTAPQQTLPEAGPDPLDRQNAARLKVEEPKGHTPYDIVHTGKAVEWKLTVRAEHIAGRLLPVPDEMARELPQRALHVKFWQGGRLTRSLWEPYDVQPELRHLPTAIAHFDWPGPVLPGARVAVRWDLWTNVRLLLTPLKKPRLVDGNLVRFDYDPRIMTRDVAPSRVRVDQVEEAVLLTLRELGYLDKEGRAFLPDEALVRNTGERSRPSPPSESRIRAAIQRLLSVGELRRALGSLGAGGLLRFPAREGESSLSLLCFVPAARPAAQEDIEAAVNASAPGVGEHRVAGHLMRIGHLGKEASAEAKVAYRHDHATAGLAGSHELPRGYTYVREHRRGL